MFQTGKRLSVSFVDTITKTTIKTAIRTVTITLTDTITRTSIKAFNYAIGAITLSQSLTMRNSIAKIISTTLTDTITSVKAMGKIIPAISINTAVVPTYTKNLNQALAIIWSDALTLTISKTFTQSIQTTFNNVISSVKEIGKSIFAVFTDVVFVNEQPGSVTILPDAGIHILTGYDATLSLHVPVVFHAETTPYGYTGVQAVLFFTASPDVEIPGMSAHLIRPKHDLHDIPIVTQTANTTQLTPHLIRPHHDLHNIPITTQQANTGANKISFSKWIKPFFTRYNRPK